MSGTKSTSLRAVAATLSARRDTRNARRITADLCQGDRSDLEVLVGLPELLGCGRSLERRPPGMNTIRYRERHVHQKVHGESVCSLS